MSFDNTQYVALGGIITLVATVLLPSIRQTIVAIIKALKEKKDKKDNE